MKSVILASALVLTSSAAFAEGLLGGLGASAEVEYSIENENFAMEAGPDLTLGGFGLAPRVYGSISSDSVISFDGVGVEATYGLTANVTLFGTVSADNEFSYQDATIGARFNF